MPATQEATPQSGSLEDASKAITGLLSVKPEDKPTKEQPPEPVRESAEPQQVPAAPEGEEGPSTNESEQATPSDETGTPETPVVQPKVFKVKDNGQEIEVTEEEALKSYLRIQDYTRKTQALADEKRTFEEGIVRVARERDAQYATHLEQLSEAIKATMPVEPDWQKLKGELAPEALAAKLLDWQTGQKHLASIKTEQDAVKARQQEDADRQWRQHVLAEQDKLEAALPELKDPEKARVIKTELAEFAISRGYTPEDVKNVTDHRLVLILRDAAEYQKSKDKAPKVANKIENALAASPPGNRSPAPKANKLTEAKQRLQKSGSVDDGAAAIAALLEKTG